MKQEDFPSMKLRSYVYLDEEKTKLGEYEGQVTYINWDENYFIMRNGANVYKIPLEPDIFIEIVDYE